MMSDIERHDDSIGARIDAVSSELNALIAEADELSSGLSSDPSTALVEVTAKSSAVMKKRMAVTRSVVMKQKQLITEKQAELKDLLEQKMREVNNIITPLNAMVKRLEEGIWTANLYLGQGEEIVQLRDGKPAKADTPVSVRQLVLAMDEECAVAAEKGGIDAMSIEEFDRWLLKSKRHLNQVFPEQRGVVALVPRWSMVDYGNPWESQQRNKDNHQTYFLIRNGERLYRYVTDFIAGERLVPTASEFTDFFYERATSWNERRPIKPDTHEWEKAEASADFRKRHYMRVGLILQGLVDRTTVFHPLPGTVRFLEADDYDEGRIVIIADGDFALTDGREVFREWQRRLMHDIRPGMRIIAASQTYRSEDQWVIHPKFASGPDPYVPYVITERIGERRMRFTYERTDKIYGYERDPDNPGWMKWGGRAPARRASCTFEINNNLVLPFDLITIEDIDRFLASRSNRHGYVEMFPLLKAARRALIAEAAEEAPFALLLTGVLSTTNNVPLSDAEVMVPTLIEWWKTSNKNHRPLVGSVEDNAKAVRMIVDEHRRRLEDIARPVNQRLVATLRLAHENALLIARRREGTYVVLEPQDDGDTYVIETTYSARGLLKDRVEWQIVGTRPSRWVIVYESPLLATWNTLVSPRSVFTEPEIAEVVERLVQKQIKEGHDVIAVMCLDGMHGNHYRSTTLSWLELEDNRDDLSMSDYWANAVAKPLTARYREPNIKSHSVRLERKTDGIIEWEFSWGSSYPTGSEWPCWEPTGRYAKGWRQLWLSDSVVKVANLAYETYREVRAHAQTLSRRVWDYERSVYVQYNENVEREAYAAFLEEYGDPDLWEGHQKTLRLKLLEPGQRDFGELETALELLVEGGHVLTGLTVSEVLDRAKVLYGFDEPILNGLDDYIIGAPEDEKEEDDEE